MNDLPTLEERFAKIRDGGFDGVEIAIPPDGETCIRARESLDKLGLALVAQQCRTTGRTVAEHIASFEDQYERALLLKPLFVNSHTGRDHFTQDENLAIFDHAESPAAQHGLPVYHETHRSRAFFSVPSTVQILKARPQLRLTGVACMKHCWKTRRRQWPSQSIAAGTFMPGLVTRKDRRFLTRATRFGSRISKRI